MVLSNTRTVQLASMVTPWVVRWEASSFGMAASTAAASCSITSWKSMLLHQNASWGFHAENCLFLGRPKLCGVLMPSLSFLLGCVAASCGGEAVLVWAVNCSQESTEYSVCCGGSWGVPAGFVQCDIVWIAPGLPAEGKTQLVELLLLNADMAEGQQLPGVHVLCSIRASSPQTSQAASPCPCSRCPQPWWPILAVAGDTPGLALALAPAVPWCNLYMSCHVQELFIIYCITAVKKYFAIRGGKEMALACFFSLRGLVWGEL